MSDCDEEAIANLEAMFGLDKKKRNKRQPAQSDRNEDAIANLEARFGL